MSKKQGRGKVRIGAEVDLELHEQLNALAEANDRSAAAEIRVALRHWVASRPGPTREGQQ